MAENDDEKTEEPTQRKLSEARKRGEIIYSPEVGAWMVLTAGAFSLMMMGGPLAKSLGQLCIGFFETAPEMAADPVSLHAMFGALMLKVGAAMGMVALAIGGAGLAARFIQDQPVWSTERMKPSLDKINPMSGFGRVFGRAAFANFTKGLLKLVVVGGAVTWALWPRDAMYETQPLRDLASFWPLVQKKALIVVQACLTAFAIIAAGDYFFTRQSYMRRMRMSRQDIRDEFRQQEGDPAVRNRIRQLRGERARRRMMAQVPKATVVITNPTHYAVALRYEKGETDAPICVAKGVDDIALKIRETAEAASVPIVEDPPLARALYAASELDETIPREHYEAVAKVISYVLKLATRRRSTPADRANQ